jgi:hypothetical protein
MEKTSTTSVNTPLLTRAAHYVRMSTEHQQYSPENQLEVVRQYATSHNMEIVQEYVESNVTDFSALLVYRNRTFRPRYSTIDQHFF